MSLRIPIGVRWGLAGLGLAALLLPLAVVAATVPGVLAEAGQIQGLQRDVAQGLLSGDASAVAEARRQLARLHRRASPLTAALRWSAALNPAASWVPGLGQEIRAWSALGRRIEADLEAADRLLEGFSLIGGDFLDVGELLAQGDATALESGASRYDQGAAVMASALTLLERGRGEPEPLLARAWPVRGLFRRLEEGEAAIITAGRMGREGSLFAADLTSALAPMARSVVGLADGTGVDGAQRQLLRDSPQRIRLAVMRAEALSRLLEGPGSRSIPEVEYLRRLAGLLSEAGRAASDMADALVPTLEEALEGEDNEGLARALASLGNEAESLATAAEEMRGTAQALADLSAEAPYPRAAQALASLAGWMDRVAKAAELAARLAPAAPAMLGMERPVTYLVLGQSADELRATGGFVSALWTITLEKGRPQRIRYYDAVRVDNWERIELYPKAPPGLEEHMNAWVWLMRDVSWDPDFPTTAQTAKAMFRLGQGLEVDGVVGINQWALLRFVEALGSLPLPEGGQVTALNLLEVLERNTDRYGRAYTDIVLDGLIRRVRSPQDVGELLALTSALYDALESRDVLLYLDDPTARQALARAGWDGAIRQDASDYLYVVDSNVGWSKADRNIGRDLRYQVDLRRQDRPRASLTLRYNNYSGPGSPPCEPQWLNRGSDYSQLKNACYWDYFRVYMPHGSRFLASTPLPLPDYSVSVEIGRGRPGEDTGRISAAHGKAVFSGLFPLPAGESKEITLVYDLPTGIVEADDDTLTYRLLVQKQPGVRGRRVALVLIAPEGYRLDYASVPATVEDNVVRLGFLLERDTLVEARWRRGSHGR